jgi:hypothetical protein
MTSSNSEATIFSAACERLACASSCAPTAAAAPRFLADLDAQGLVELAGEIRQLEASVARLASMLVPDVPDVAQPKSASIRPPRVCAGTVAAAGAPKSGALR